MTPTAQRTDTMRRRLGGFSALVASAAIIAACSSQTGGGATNPPAATTAPGTAAAGPVVLTVSTDPTLGMYVAGKDGLSLYIFTDDTGSTSTCTGDCAGTWPALLVSSASDVSAGAGVTGAIGTTARADGTTQVTLNGHPIYYYSGDSKAGDTMGQGKFNKWYLASPAGTTVGMAATPTQAPGGTPAATKCSGAYCY